MMIAIRFNFSCKLFMVCALIISCLVAVLQSPTFAAERSRQVLKVIDGDTIVVIHNQQSERTRLRAIDCPEKGQDYGKRAKQAALAFALGNKITLQRHCLDKYGRTFADVLLSDGTNVNHTLAKDGWCWWYRKYAPGDTILEGLEQGAREAQNELWVDPWPMPPWR